MRFDIGKVVLLSGVLPLPFVFSFSNSQEVRLENTPPISNGISRIAIIGGGAGGSSAAFWIAKGRERHGLNIEVDVYEREAHIGGRSTTVYPYNDESLPPLELGGSIFVQANRNMWRASTEFNLTRLDFDSETPTIGIWDGKRVLFSTSTSNSSSDVVQHYGSTSPKKTFDMVSSLNVSELYAVDSPTWANLADLVSDLGWTDLVSQSTSRYFQSAGVSYKYIHEFIEAFARANYDQNADFIHGLGGVCSLATTGATSIKGGNFQIFENFLKRAGATVNLNATVASIARASAPSHDWIVQTSTGGSRAYKAVIFAAPFHTSAVAISPSLRQRIPVQPYVHLHVTLLVTNSSSFNPAYFGLAAHTEVPKLIMTTSERARAGHDGPEFSSIQYRGEVREGEWAVKIFSNKRIEDEFLERILPGSVRWVYRKEWDAYPELRPTTSFPPVKIDSGLYYVNGLEPIISTMETQTVAARNVVQLLLLENFGSGICSKHNSSRTTVGTGASKNITASDDFVFGWDC